MNESNISMHPAFGFEPTFESDEAFGSVLEPIGSKGEWQARAALGELLVLSFSKPARPLTITVTLGDYSTAAQNIAQELGLMLPSAFAEELAGYEGTSDSALLEKLQKEHKRLFGSEEATEPTLSTESTEPAQPASTLPLYESNWREEGAGPAEIIEAHVAEAYRSCGLMATPGQGDPLDHLEAEIEFLEFVALAHIGLVDTNPEAPVGADGYGTAYASFMDEHVSKWMPRFADAVIAETELPFYRAAGLLLKAFANL